MARRKISGSKLKKVLSSLHHIQYGLSDQRSPTIYQNLMVQCITDYGMNSEGEYRKGKRN